MMIRTFSIAGSYVRYIAQMDKAQYVEVLAAESQAFIAAVVESLDAPVTHLGDWTGLDLAIHQGSIWQFATANVVAAGDKPHFADPWPGEGGANSAIPGWLTVSRDRMLEVLTSAEPSAPARSFAENDQTAGFWQRRMVAETVVHRWDAQSIADAAQPIDPIVAADGIDEYAQVGLQYSSSRKNRIYPSTSLHLHCTDTEGEWMLIGDDGPNVTVTREHGKGDAAIRCDASTLLLWIWGRDAGSIEIFGDAEVATTWRMLAP
jgi:uncharacterized protein (TIGR03083 family)